jgi:hypothetical protein
MTIYQPVTFNADQMAKLLSPWFRGSPQRSKFYKIRPCHMQNSELGGTHIEFMIGRYRR